MTDAPASVLNTFRRLKGEYPFYIALTRINGRYYVYRRSSRWDSATHKVRSVSEYIGSIDASGAFAPKRRPDSQPRQAAAAEPISFDAADQAILKCLSHNARLPRARMGAIAGVSPRSVESRIRRMSKRHGLAYRGEYDLTALGYSSYFLLIRSDKEPPPRGEIIRLLEENPWVQFAAVTKGRYCMMIHFVAEDTERVDKLIRSVRGSHPFLNFPSRWYITPASLSLSSIPVRDVFFNLIKERVWRRSKESPRREKGMFLLSEYAVLRELNLNSLESFSSIDKKYGLNAGNARYSYVRLRERKLLSPMASLVNIPVKYNGVVFMRIINQKSFLDTREALLRHIIDDEGMVPTRFSYVADLYIPDCVMFIMPVFRDGELEAEALRIANLCGGVLTESLVITDILVGGLNYVRLDRQHTGQYPGLVSRYKTEEPKEKISYD